MAGGRPSKYESHVKPRLEEVRKWRSEGKTLEDIARLLGIALSVLCDYQTKYSELSEALKNGTDTQISTLRSVLWTLANPQEYVSEEITEYEIVNGQPIAKTVRTKKTRTKGDVRAANLLLGNLDKSWHADPDGYRLKREELDWKKEQAGNDNWSEFYDADDKKDKK